MSTQSNTIHGTSSIVSVDSIGPVAENVNAQKTKQKNCTEISLSSRWCASSKSKTKENALQVRQRFSRLSFFFSFLFVCLWGALSP